MLAKSTMIKRKQEGGEEVRCYLEVPHRLPWPITENAWFTSHAAPPLFSPFLQLYQDIKPLVRVYIAKLEEFTLKKNKGKLLLY